MEPQPVWLLNNFKNEVRLSDRESNLEIRHAGQSSTKKRTLQPPEQDSALNLSCKKTNEEHLEDTKRRKKSFFNCHGAHGSGSRVVYSSRDETVFQESENGQNNIIKKEPEVIDLTTEEDDEDVKMFKEKVMNAKDNFRMSEKIFLKNTSWYNDWSKAMADLEKMIPACYSVPNAAPNVLKISNIEIIRMATKYICFLLQIIRGYKENIHKVNADHRSLDSNEDISTFKDEMMNAEGWMCDKIRKGKLAKKYRDDLNKAIDDLRKVIPYKFPKLSRVKTTKTATKYVYFLLQIIRSTAGNLKNIDDAKTKLLFDAKKAIASSSSLEIRKLYEAFSTLCEADFNKHLQFEESRLVKVSGQLVDPLSNFVNF